MVKWWKEEYKDTYKKMLQSHVNRLERKAVRSAYEQKKLETLKKKLKNL